MPPAPPNLPMRPTWWGPLVGKASASVPERTIRDLGDGSIPSRMVFYSYFFRPNYFIRQKVEKMVREFQLIKKVGDIVATMHVRRGDVLLHTGQARFYIPLKTYVQGALPFIKSLGVTTILLLTDSQAVINEALACEKDFPEICRDLSWRFVEKKRWFGAEGGWEVSAMTWRFKGIMCNPTTDVVCDSRIGIITSFYFYLSSIFLSSFLRTLF